MDAIGKGEAFMDFCAEHQGSIDDASDDLTDILYKFVTDDWSGAGEAEDTADYGE